MTAKGTVVGIVSAKGGVGKTTTVVNLGTALVTQFNKKVLVIDANIRVPNLSLYLGLLPLTVDITDVLKNKIPITKSIYTHVTKLHVLPGPVTLEKKVNTNNLRKKIEAILDQYEYILLDSPPDVTQDVAAVMDASDELQVVTNPEFPTVATTLKTIELAREKKVPIVGVVLNRVHRKSHEMSEKEVADSLDSPVVAVIPEDPENSEAVSHRMPIVVYSPNSASSKKFKELAACLTGEASVPGFFDRIKKLFKFR